MPRRHRAARERPPDEDARTPGGLALARLQAPGYAVWQSTKAGPYRCPGCQQLIAPGTAHLVVYPEEDPSSRRHWHTPCWERELRRIR
jgi:hypothetical protein